MNRRRGVLGWSDVKMSPNLNPICGKCNRIVGEKALYCPHCGRDLAWKRYNRVMDAKRRDGEL